MSFISFSKATILADSLSLVNESSAVAVAAGGGVFSDFMRGLAWGTENRAAAKLSTLAVAGSGAAFASAVGIDFGGDWTISFL
jgi:hypothetical protein